MRKKKTKSGVPINPVTGKAETGRPTVMTPDVVRKLEEAFARDASDVEACFHAGISRQTLNVYQKANKDFLDRKELLRAGVSLAVRNTVVDGIIGRAARLDAKGRVLRKEVPANPDLGLKWMERKLKGEFSTRVEKEVGKPGEFDDASDEEIDKELEELEKEEADADDLAEDSEEEPAPGKKKASS